MPSRESFPRNWWGIPRCKYLTFLSSSDPDISKELLHGVEEGARIIDFQSISSYVHDAAPVRMTVGASIIVEGMVQGVGFRYFVYTKASRLGLTGFVRNLASDAVEIEVEGDRSLIEE